MSEKKKELGWFKTLAFFGFSVGAAYLVFQIPSGPKECGSEVAAYVMTQSPVRAAMKSPDSTSFPSATAPGVSINRSDECAFDVVAYVDAQNGFGATVRTRYYAEISHNPDTGTWRMESLVIE